jgi:hypothetical protein
LVRDLSSQVSSALFILSDPPSRGFPISVSLLENDRLKITGAPSLSLGSPVKVLETDRLWLGEIVECHPDGAAIVHISHSLTNLAELTRLAERFTGHVSDKVADERPQAEPTLS